MSEDEKKETTPTHKFYIEVRGGPNEPGFPSVEGRYESICIEVPAETSYGEVIPRETAKQRLGRDLTQLLDWWRRG